MYFNRHFSNNNTMTVPTLNKFALLVVLKLKKLLDLSILPPNVKCDLKAEQDQIFYRGKITRRGKFLTNGIEMMPQQAINISLKKCQESLTICISPFRGKWPHQVAMGGLTDLFSTKMLIYIQDFDTPLSWEKAIEVNYLNILEEFKSKHGLPQKIIVYVDNSYFNIRLTNLLIFRFYNISQLYKYNPCCYFISMMDKNSRFYIPRKHDFTLKNPTNGSITTYSVHRNSNKIKNIQLKKFTTRLCSLNKKQQHFGYKPFVNQKIMEALLEFRNHPFPVRYVY